MQYFLIFILLASGLGDLPRRIALGPITGLGALTIIYVIGALVFAATHQKCGAGLAGTIPLLCAFLAWTSASILWYRPTTAGAQRVIVMLASLGLLWISTSPKLSANAAKRVVGVYVKCGAWVGVVCFWTVQLLFPEQQPNIVSPRAMAIATLLGVARYLAEWRHGKMVSFFMALVLTASIGASLSRTAFLAALVMFVTSQFSKGSLSRWSVTAALLAVTCFTSIYLVQLSDTLHDRFFSGDTSITVLGIPINMTGRTASWHLLLESFWEAPLIGKGTGSSDELVDGLNHFGHAHNEYLRILHDCGFIGLLLWVTASIMMLERAWSRWQKTDRLNPDTGVLHEAAFLALIGVAITSVTDNSLMYITDMAPLSIMVGVSAKFSARTTRRVGFKIIVPAVLKLKKRGRDTTGSAVLSSCDAGQ